MFRWLCASVVLASLSGCGDDSATNGTGSGAAGTGASSATGGSGGAGTGAGGGTGGTGTGAGGGSGGAAPAGELQGFGAVTEGHASCDQAPEEFHVTTLADDGAGSLRDALSEGCRHVVFDLAGTIVLESDLNLAYSYVTVDGASAPAPGITIEQPGDIGTTLEARNSVGPIHDVIIRYLRMDGQATSHLNVGDIWGLDGENHAVYNIVIDHVTAIAATDGAFDVWSEVHDVTLSYNLVLDTVTMLHLSTSDIAKRRERFSIHHNVFARNNERQIRIRHDNDLIDYRNNVIYGWAWMEAGGAGIDIAYDAGEVNPSMNIVGNVFHFVSGLNGDEDDAIKWARGADEGAVYFGGNVLPAGEQDATSNSPELTIPAAAQVTTDDAATLGTTLMPNVGTHHRTAAEEALLDEIAAAL